MSCDAYMCHITHCHVMSCDAYMCHITHCHVMLTCAIAMGLTLSATVEIPAGMVILGLHKISLYAHAQLTRESFFHEEEMIES